MLALRIARSALSRPPEHRYGEHRSQVAELHVPRGDGPFPVAVLLHGGHWRTRYGKLVVRPLARDLARRGIAAWNLEYRRLGDGGGWPMTFDDVEAGIGALAALGDRRLDLRDVTAVGHSAGGQLALFAAASGLVGRVAALAPVTNLAAAGATAEELLGGSPQTVPERFAIADPLRRAPLGVPVLLVHPTHDATVSVRHSRAFAERGGDVELVETAGRHRDPIDPGHAAWRAAAEWLRRRVTPARSAQAAPARP